jgi:hypothetical protein
MSVDRKISPWIITRENCSKKIVRELFAFLREVCTLGFVSQFPLLVFVLSLGVLRFNFRFPEVFRT